MHEYVGAKATCVCNAHKHYDLVTQMEPMTYGVPAENGILKHGVRVTCNEAANIITTITWFVRNMVVSKFLKNVSLS